MTLGIFFITLIHIIFKNMLFILEVLEHFRITFAIK